MFNNIIISDKAEMLQLICLSCISIMINLYIVKYTFNKNLIYLYKKLFMIKNELPMLYSYKHISLMIISYFLITFSFLVLSIFYLVLQIYSYANVQISYLLVSQSEKSIKIFTMLSSTLNILSVVLYYIRNNDNFMKVLKDNYCLLESFISLMICIVFIIAACYSKPLEIPQGDIMNYFIVVIVCFIVLDISLQKLQIRKKDNSRANAIKLKLKNTLTINRHEDIYLIYNVITCNGLAIILLFYMNYIGSFTFIKSISYILLNITFIGISKRYKTALDELIQKKEIK